MSRASIWMRRRLAVLAAALGLSALAATPASAVAQLAQSDSAAIAELPLREMPVAEPGHRLVFLITGDGGYAAGDRGMTEAFNAQGIPVVVLNAREYLTPKKTPDQTAADAARIIDHYMRAWQRDSVIFVGYSRGADIAPFILTRVPERLRDHLSLVAMIGLADHANFEFHWPDLVKDTRRPDDLPVQPEMLHVHGVRMLCLYGTREKGSLCPSLPPSVVTADRHGGKHALSAADAAAVVQRILRELEPAPSH
jgi:type IV secretory pathway VirJ component